MSIRAEVRLDSSELLFGRTVRELPELELRVEPQSATDVVFFSAQSPDEASLEEFEAAIEAEDFAENLRVVVEGETDRVYALDVNLDRPLLQNVAANLGINVLSSHTRAGTDGWTLELEVPERQALREFLSFCEKAGITFETRRLFSPDASREGTNFGLSELQHETLMVALESGYFDVPRQVSQRELARKLNASPAAVSQRLRRAVATLLRNSIGAK
jgi:predicted DNA binding protein